MTRVVVRIARQLNQSYIQLESGPEALMMDSKPRSFALGFKQLSNWPEPTPVREYGKALLQALLEKSGDTSIEEDTSIRDAISTVIHGGGTLNFLLEDTALHQHSWEALWDQKFLALGADWSISRLVNPRSDPMYEAKLMEFPIRMMAVLGAARIPAVDEWEKLWEAVTAAAESGLEIKLNVLVAEKQLLEVIDGLGATPVPRVTLTASPMPTQRQDLLSAINTFAPQILHFFCHGESNTGESKSNVPTLLLTTGNNFEIDSPLRLDIESLTAKTRIKDGWIVVLNACRAGEGSSLLHSLTHQLVERGVPAAVGMMEEIDAVYAQLFCKSFYRAAFNEILRVQNVLKSKPAGESEEIHWTEVLREPRSSLSEVYEPADGKREWTLPVLYIRRHGFRVRLAATDADQQVINGFLSILGERREEGLRALSPNNGS